MNTLYAILAGLVAAVALVLGSLFGGIKYERARQAKRKAEGDRDRVLEVDADAMVNHDVVRSLPHPDKLRAASEAASDAVADFNRRRRRDD